MTEERKDDKDQQTIKSYISELIFNNGEKLNVKDRTQLAVFAIKNNLI